MSLSTGKIQRFIWLVLGGASGHTKSLQLSHLAIAATPGKHKFEGNMFFKQVRVS